MIILYRKENGVHDKKKEKSHNDNIDPSLTLSVKSCIFTNLAN